MKLFILLLVLKIFLFANSENKNEQNSSLLEKTLYKAEVVRDYISNKFTYFTTNVDNFLANEPDNHIYDNPSFIFLEYTFDKSEGNSVENKARFKIKTRLPRSKAKYRIEIGNKEDTNDNSNDIRIEDIDKNDNVNVGVNYIDNIKEYLSLSHGAGIRLKFDEFDPYAKVKANKKIDYSNNWKGDTTQRFYFSHERNLESTTSFEISRIFSDTYKFSNYNEYFWRKDDEDNNFYNSLRLYQNLSKRDYISYVASATTNDEESNLKVKNYQTYVSFRYYIKKWMYYDVIPRVTWQEEDDFDSNYGIRINLGMFIGRKP